MEIGLIYHWSLIISVLLNEESNQCDHVGWWKGNEGDVLSHIPEGKTWSRVYLRISQYQIKVELVVSVYKSILLFFFTVKSCSASFILVQRIERKSGIKRKRNNQNDKYKYFISQALYTNNFNIKSIRNKSLMNELFLDGSRFHFWV